MTMTEAWKVYIKGVPGRGAEVLKVLEDLGGRNGYLYQGENDEWVYYIDHEGNINYEYLDSEIAKIIMDNYREIKLPERWKDGDVLVDNDNPNRFVIKLDVWKDGNFKAYLFVTQKHIQERPIVTFCDAD